MILITKIRPILFYVLTHKEMKIKIYQFFLLLYHLNQIIISTLSFMESVNANHFIFDDLYSKKFQVVFH